MKTLGLIGGTSWVSTLDYYREINQGVNKKLGGIQSAKLILYSVNFADAKKLLDRNDREGFIAMFAGAAQKLEAAGAEGLILCANTPHRIAGEIQNTIGIPLIHIAEMTANEIRRKGFNKVALLGTKYTMEEDFFKDKLSAQNIATMIPNDAEREFIQYTIFNELAIGVFKPESKAAYITLINNIVQQGAQAIIFGCSEIPLLIKQEDCPMPVFDTVEIHVAAAVEFAVGS